MVVNDFGLSDRNGRMPAKFFTEDTLGTLIDTLDFHDHLNPETEEVEVRTLDDYVAECKIPHVDLLKIDVEGAEHQVLNGAVGLLRNKQLRLIQFEYGYANAYTHFLMNDYNKLFAGYGYKIGKLCHDGVDFSPYHVEMNNFESGPNYVACLEGDLPLLDCLQRARSGS